jgi:hypothetical protein
MSDDAQLASLLAVLQRLPDPFDVALFIFEQYRAKFGIYPDVMRPKGFNEKIQARKLFDRRPILTTMADKAAVRDYVAERVGRHVLPVWYHLTEDPADLPFASLPARYVLKATHGSGWVHIVKQHDPAQEPALIQLCREWLTRNFYDQSVEWAYRAVPRRIAAEEFLDNGAGEPAEDYKFFTFNGRVEFLQVDTSRFAGHKKNFFDRYWKPVPLRQEAENSTEEIPKPRNFAALIELAEALAKGIDFVRADLYSVGGKVYFGELTATPGNGYFRFDPPEYDLTFGKLWQMDISSLSTLYGGRGHSHGKGKR